MKSIFRYFLIASLFGLLAGILISIYLYNKKPADLSSAKSDFKLTSRELVSAFESNEPEATAKYVNKIIEVHGNISSVENNSDGSINVILTEPGQMSGIICTFRNSDEPGLAGLQEGNSVKIRGICNGFLMDVSMTNCVLVN